MHFSALLLTMTVLALGSASVIPMHNSIPSRAQLRGTYTRRALEAIQDVTLDPQNFAHVQTDRRRAFGESSVPRLRVQHKVAGHRARGPPTSDLRHPRLSLP
ncbi:hypothetical protein GGR50DRAFT_698616 [Xylaria sp. CBS 124048]|nr:hypothetical protein GGR50DRAFT_698616 [Xylaria sp. CBS 124048]